MSLPGDVLPVPARPAVSEAAVLRAAWPSDAALASWPGLDAWLERVMAEAQAHWPSALLHREACLRALAAAIQARTPVEVERLSALDLLLVAACLAGDRAALAALDALLGIEVERAVRPIEPGLVDEVGQQLRERLLVGGGNRLAAFSGDGPLGAWLRTAAVRLALNARRSGPVETTLDSGAQQPLLDADPELALLQARYRQAFRSAFSAAIAALTPRQRTLLRLTALDGLTLAQVGAMYRKDAATISRWLDRTRATLLDATRQRLRCDLHLDERELDSLMRAAGSELNLSLRRLLASQGGEPPA